MLFSAMGLTVLGGFSFILIKQAQNYIETNWDRIVSEASAAERDDLDQQEEQDLVKRNLMLCGLACFFTLFVVLSVLSNVVRLVTRVSAYSIMLQSCSITLLPFGVVLIAAGLFIADTAASVEAPVAAFAVFVLGVVVIMLSLLGCFAVTIDSRGLLKMFMYIVFVLAVVFLLFGLVALVQAETLKQRLIDRWESIRRVLPPTFSGKFDREQFSIFLEANLLLLGFLSICMGILLGIQWYASLRLRKALKVEAEAEEEAASYSQPGSNLHNKPNRMKFMWKRQWTHGSKKSRRCIKCVCCCVLLAFMLAIVLATLALYFATSCASLSSFEESLEYYPLGRDVELRSTYTRGLTSVTVNASAVTGDELAVTFSKSAFRDGLQADGFPAVSNSSSGGTALSVVPASKTKVMGFDISCQLADLQLAVPGAAAYGGNTVAASLTSPALTFVTVSDRASVEVDLIATAVADRPRFRRVDMSTTSGAIDVRGLLVGNDGMAVQSDLGEQTMEFLDAHCDENTLGEASNGVRLTSDRGSVSVYSSSFTDCDLHVTGNAALIYMSQVHMANTGGGATMFVTGTRGLIQLEDVATDVFDIKSDAGSVRVSHLNGTQFMAASGSGSVEGTRLRMGMGTVQAETDSGAVELDLATFAGSVNIVTGGRITCTGAGFDLSPACEVTRINGQNHVQLSSINCEAQGDCLYAGSLTVTSGTGSVKLHADAWDRTAA